jgi:hypothetical protein
MPVLLPIFHAMKSVWITPHALSSAAAVLFPSCHGVLGLVTARGEPTTGGYVTEVRSTGFEIRNIPGYRGLTVGGRSTCYFHPASDSTLAPTSSSSWGAVALPDIAPVFTRSETCGVDLAWEPSFWGLSCGIDSRACAALKMNQSALLRVNTTVPLSPDRYQYQNSP